MTPNGGFVHVAMIRCMWRRDHDTHDHMTLFHAHLIMVTCTKPPSGVMTGASVPRESSSTMFQQTFALVRTLPHFGVEASMTVPHCMLKCSLCPLAAAGITRALFSVAWIKRWSSCSLTAALTDSCHAHCSAAHCLCDGAGGRKVLPNFPASLFPYNFIIIHSLIL